MRSPRLAGNAIICAILLSGCNAGISTLGSETAQGPQTAAVAPQTQARIFVTTYMNNTLSAYYLNGMPAKPVANQPDAFNRTR